MKLNQTSESISCEGKPLISRLVEIYAVIARYDELSKLIYIPSLISIPGYFLSFSPLLLQPLPPTSRPTALRTINITLEPSSSHDFLSFAYYRLNHVVINHNNFWISLTFRITDARHMLRLSFKPLTLDRFILLAINAADHMILHI